MIVFELLIKNFRVKKKLTEDQLAFKAGISQGHLNRLENGSRLPSLETLQKIGNALKMNPARLVKFDLTYKQNKKSKPKSKSTPK